MCVTDVVWCDLLVQVKNASDWYLFVSCLCEGLSDLSPFNVNWRSSSGDWWRPIYWEWWRADLTVFYIQLYRRRYLLFVLNWFSTRVSDDQKYVCINTRKLKGLHLYGTSFQSSPKINRMLITRPFAYNESLQHPTIAVLLLNSDLDFFQPLSCVHLFQGNQRFQVIESRGPTRFEKALNLIFLKHA